MPTFVVRRPTGQPRRIFSSGMQGSGYFTYTHSAKQKCLKIDLKTYSRKSLTRLLEKTDVSNLHLGMTVPSLIEHLTITSTIQHRNTTLCGVLFLIAFPKEQRFLR